MRDTGWFKSSHSGGASDACVEVRITGEVAQVRDSKNPEAVLTIDLPRLLDAVRLD